MFMSRMKIIAMDTHCRFCQGGVINESGKEITEFTVPTTIPAIIEQIEKVSRPRTLVIEEGPLADWLSRGLAEHVDQMIVCDPFRNALIAKEGDKTDAIDWRKLAQLCRGGFVKPVHHPSSLARSVLRQHVQIYHERVRRRVSESHKIIWLARRYGVMARQRDLTDSGPRTALLSQLPADPTVQKDMLVMLEGFDLLCRQVKTLRSHLLELSKGEPMIACFCQVTGVKHVRAATFLAIVDTPFRFASKQKLWKYMGIGLEIRQSGSSRPRLTVPKRCNRVLKNVMLGAAKSAVASGNNVFADQYQRWINDGCSPRIARRNVARSQATVMWGMWKSQSGFDQQFILRPAATLS
jgi:transposase